MAPAPTENVRRRLDLRGQVQGVGFRPFVYRLATSLRLAGHVANNSNGAIIEIEGTPEHLATFERRLRAELPPLARISDYRRRDIAPTGRIGFEIQTSQSDARTRPEVTPDAATCPDCLRELADPADRRHGYAFINCTNCGPRYSIIQTVPYDRPATTMAVFQMCPACAREYADPADRRFHAQPNACPVCGPQLAFHRIKPPPDNPVADDADPVRAAAQLLAAGGILAIKGIGGYHLACRADLEETVTRLRERKLRDGKPLAIMVPSLAAARRLCHLTPADADALSSPAAPIVLAPQAAGHGLAAGIAPECDTFGLMLPYAPVHHLLFAHGLGPLVMTSANLSGQPLTYRDDDALRELRDVADAFLTHNRDIFRPIDDSVAFTFRDQAIPIRRARGYAPQPIRLAGFAPTGELHALRYRRILAVGPELKSTVCLLTRGEAIVSEHLGDLGNADAYRHFVQAIERLRELYDFAPHLVAHDLHPRYLSTTYARGLDCPTLAVQHHHAHIAAVMAECNHAGPIIGLSCDGTGYGTDGATWGCEVLRCERAQFERLGHLDYFPLIGADTAAIETWRPAAALLHQSTGDAWIDTLPRDVPGAPSAQTLRAGAQQLAVGLNTPPTSSLGRVFDAVSYLLGLCGRNRHEAEAAMTLESAAANGPCESYPYTITNEPGRLLLSLAPTVRALVAAQQAGEPVPVSAARFHETLARLLSDAAIHACEQTGIGTVALSGGCFANRRLLARLVELLEAARLVVRYHQLVPSGDGGVALGQAFVAAWRLAEPVAHANH
jgi:hydrogenase maturation protein HypF